MNFSSKAAAEQKGFTSNTVNKGIDPGVHVVRILDMTLRPTPYDTAQFLINMTVETAPIGNGFEGFQRDKNNPAAGNYEGQIGYVDHGSFAFKHWPAKAKADGTMQEEQTVDNQIWRWLTIFSEMIGVKDFVTAANLEAATIEDYFNQIKPYLVNNSRWVYMTIGGREYEKDGYTKYSLYLAKGANSKLPVVPAQVDANSGLPVTTGPAPVKLVPFNETLHIRRKETPGNVSSFPASGDSLNGQPNGQLQATDVLPF